MGSRNDKAPPLLTPSIKERFYSRMCLTAGYRLPTTRKWTYGHCFCFLVNLLKVNSFIWQFSWHIPYWAVYGLQYLLNTEMNYYQYKLVRDFSRSVWNSMLKSLVLYIRSCRVPHNRKHGKFWFVCSFYLMKLTFYSVPAYYRYLNVHGSGAGATAFLFVGA